MFFGARDGASHPPDLFEENPDSRDVLPTHAQQLEVVHGEREGFLSCESASHVLYDVQAEPAFDAGRLDSRRGRRPSHQLLEDGNRVRYRYRLRGWWLACPERRFHFARQPDSHDR